MDQTRIDAGARLLAGLRRRPGPAAPIEELPEHARPRDLPEAYRMQSALAVRLTAAGAGPVVGWKIGCTTPVMQRYLGIDHPCAGRLYRHCVHTGGTTLSASAYRQLGLECEIAVRLGHPLSARAGGHTESTVATAVSSVMASIEIVEHRFADFAHASTASLVADDFFSCGCVHCAELPLAQVPDLAALRGGFRIDGAAPTATGTGREILGHPLAALAWLANHAAATGLTLPAGTLVTLGSVVKTLYPEPGMRVEAVFEGLGTAAVNVVD